MPQAHQTMFGFETDNSMVTSDLSVLNLNASVLRSGAAYAPSNSLGGSTNLLSASTGGPNLTNKGSAPSSDDDNSYVVGYMGRGGELEAGICSDAEIGLTEDARSGALHAPIERIQHGDRVVIRKGNVLFVPFKATTVETPNGIVHIDAKAVALVSSTEAGLSRVRPGRPTQRFSKC